MKLSVTSSKFVTVETKNGEWGLRYSTRGHAVEPDGYDLRAKAPSLDELRALIACAEPDGGELRVGVEDLLNRTESLFNEWQAAIREQAQAIGKAKG